MALRKIKRADVPHYVPVKEGGEYPVDKKGQYKLFHTHQWPKGYTPERMRAINDIQFPVAGMGLGGDSMDVDTKIAQNLVQRTLAKSTVPIEKMKDLVLFPEDQRSSVNTSFVVTGTDGAGIRNSLFGKPEMYFQPGTNTIQMRNINEMRGPTNISYGLMHELGHATDFAERPGEFVKKVNDSDLFPYNSRSVVGGAHPDLEGVADAFALAHTRVTRSDVRNSLYGDETTTGYNYGRWTFPAHGVDYVKSKAAKYEKETGEEFPYDETEQDFKPTPKKTRKKKQPTLFTEEQMGPKKRKK